jgi:undecaprenyl-diphosphatase
MTPPLGMLRRMDSHDRALLGRWSLGSHPAPLLRRAWITVTHAGGAVTTIAAAAIPILMGPWSRMAGIRASIALALSHLVVQAIKRSVQRDRPQHVPHIRCPDRFSFPSGHATAAMAVAMSYGLALPSLALPLIGFAMLVGWSRVVLGVHYPGDVLFGQLIAVCTVAGMALGA